MLDMQSQVSDREKARQCFQEKLRDGLRDMTPQAVEVLTDCRIPKIFWNARLAELEQRPPKSNQAGLFLSGGTGTLKSVTAAALLIDALPTILDLEFHPSRNEFGPVEVAEPKRGSVLWVYVPRLFHELQRNFRNDSGPDLVDECVRARALVLDDIGAHAPQPWMLEKLTLIVNERIENGRRTLATSNLDIPAIDKHAPRLASRLSAMKLFRLDGPDRRPSWRSEEVN